MALLLRECTRPYFKFLIGTKILLYFPIV